MPEIKDITNAASYRGDSNLGGSSFGSFELDVRPIQQLANYTFLYNKSEYDQRQKDADEKIKQLAGLTAYNLVNGLPKDKDQLIEAQAKLVEFMAEEAANGTPKSPKDKIQKELAFQTKIKDQIKLIDAANARYIGYNLQKDAINKDPKTSAAQKENLLKELDNQVNNTDIFTTIKALPDFKEPNTDVGKPFFKETGVIRILPNGIKEDKLSVFDPRTTRNDSFLLVNGFTLPELPENATELQKQEYRQRLLSGDTNTVWQDAAKQYKLALLDPKYKKQIVNDDMNVIAAPDGAVVATSEIDYDNIKRSNPIIGDVFALVDRWNEYATKMKADAQEFYTDDLGNKVKVLSSINPDDYEIIDKEKIEPVDLVFLQKFAKAAPDKVEKDYKYTGDATKIKLENIQQAGANKREGMQQAGANYRARLEEAGKDRRSKSGGDGSGKLDDLIEKPAILFGQHIERLKDKFKSNGNNPIVVEYGGLDEKTRIATGVKEGQKIQYNPDGTYLIADENGKQLTIGLIEDLSQGFIEAVKTTDIDPTKDKDGTMAAGFQKNSEANFNRIWGTTSGKVIWDNWDASPEPVKVAETKPATSTNNKSSEQPKIIKTTKNGAPIFKQ